MSRAVRFAAIYAARRTAHEIADYWVQTDHQAVTKTAAGSPGRAACLAHVGSYTITSLATVLAANRVFHLRLGWRGIAMAEAVSAATHYTADRREHGALFRLADKLGKGHYLRHRGGSVPLDQSWHHAATALAATLAALDGKGQQR